MFSRSTLGQLNRLTCLQLEQRGYRPVSCIDYLPAQQKTLIFMGYNSTIFTYVHGDRNSEQKKCARSDHFVFLGGLRERECETIVAGPAEFHRGGETVRTAI